MTTPDLERRIRTWYADEIGEAEAAPSAVYAFLAAIPQAMPREQGLFGRRTFVLLAAAVLLVGLLAGAIAAGSGLLKLPVILPLDPSPSGEAITPSPSASLPLVFYLGEPGVWVASADGSGAHELVPDANWIELSADGKLLGFAVDAAVSVAEVVGPEPRLTNIRDVSVTGRFSFSPDATKLAFVRGFPAGDQNYGPTVIAIMDLASGSVVELGSTAVEWPEGYNDSPQWSPDGRSLVFARQEIGMVNFEHRLFDRTLYIVNADGGNLLQLVPTELFATSASWSPDGSQILFTSAAEWLGLDDSTGQRENFNLESDVYSVRPDGTELRRLTSDTVPRVDHGVPVQWGATSVSWTRDERIIFTRWPLGDLSNGSPRRPPTELWVMDADGGNQQQLDRTDLAELSAAGCVVCPYPLEHEGYYIGAPLAYWQPAP